MYIQSLLIKDASQKHYINIGRVFMVSLVAITVFASFWKWGLVAIMIGVTASMITQLLPAVLAVTVPTGLRITKAGIVSGIIVGFFVAIAVMYNGKDFLGISIPALPEGLRFDASFWGLVFNIPVMLIVSQFTTEPNPEAVARIRKALDDEFKLN